MTIAHVEPPHDSGMDPLLGVTDVALRQAVLETSLGTNHPDVGVVLGALAKVCLGTGRDSEAAALQDRAARIKLMRPRLR